MFLSESHVEWVCYEYLYFLQGLESLQVDISTLYSSL